MRSPKTGHSRGLAAVVAAVVAAVPMRLLKWPSRTRVVVAAGAAVRLRTANANGSETFILPTNARKHSRRIRSRPAPNPQAALMAPS